MLRAIHNRAQIALQRGRRGKIPERRPIDHGAVKRLITRNDRPRTMFKSRKEEVIAA